MAKILVECIRCKTIRYIDRMVPVGVDYHVQETFGIPEVYRCGAKASCKARRKQWRKDATGTTG